MNILIDTHILLWALYTPGKLTKSQQSILTDDANDVYVSAVSLWEISLKFSVNKLKIEGFNVNEIFNIIEKSGFNTVDLNPFEAISFCSLPRVKNKDPFDRMLVWQSIQKGYYLMSSDKDISEYKKYGLKLL